MSSAGPNGTNHFGGRLGAMPERANGSRPAAESVAPEGTQLAIIGRGVTITGSVEAEDDLQIDGRVMGDVRCGTLLLSEGGLINGNLYADRARLSGTIDGSVDATDVAIEPGAHIKGDVSYARLRIATGGIFEGTMTHRAAPAAAVEAEGLKVVEGDRASQRVHRIE